MLLYNFQNAQRVYLGNIDISKLFIGSAEIFSSVQGDPYSDYVVLLNHFNTDFSDSSTNNYTLTATGTLTPITSSYFKFGDGSYSSVSTSTLKVTGSNLIFGETNFTVEGWYFAVAAGTLDLFSNGNFNSAGGLLMTIDPDGRLNFLENSQLRFFTSTNTFPYFQWVHVALTKENNVYRVFVNGNLVITHSGNYNHTSDIFGIGCKTVDIGSSLSFLGYIDDFRITNGVARYTSNFTPPTQQLPDPSDSYGNNVSLLLHMENLSGSQTFIDSSTNNFALTAFGNAQINPIIKKFGNGSGYFAYGDSSYLQSIPSDKFGLGTGDFTIEMWLYKNTSITNWNGFFCINRYDNNGILIR
jgi:hypothetical protein